jgi:hypothetical protein
MHIRFIGDIHNNWKRYKREIACGADMTIQVGDFGIGFGREEELANVDWNKNKFIRGNHDNPSMCKEFAGYVSDGSVVLGTSIFCVGGAFSIDRADRVEGEDWWPDEEMGYEACCEALESYATLKPDVVVSHDCPSVALPYTYGDPVSSTTSFLNTLLKIHAPKLWVFGHYHRDVEKLIYPTRFVCVKSYIDIEV